MIEIEENVEKNKALMFTIKRGIFIESLSRQLMFEIVKLGSLVSHTDWSNISEGNSNFIENLKKGPEL